MQAALEQVAQHCSAELDAYTQCVERHPDDWSAACAARQQELNACSAKCSGLVNSLKERCQPQIEQYERCLKANPSNADTCVPLLEKLWVCTEEAFGSPADARSGS